MISNAARRTNLYVNRLFSSKKKGSNVQKYDGRKGTSQTTTEPIDNRKAPITNPDIKNGIVIKVNAPEQKLKLSPVLFFLNQKKVMYNPVKYVFDYMKWAFPIFQLYGLTTYIACYPLFQKLFLLYDNGTLVYLITLGVSRYFLWKQTNPELYSSFIFEVKVHPDLNSLFIKYDLQNPKSMVVGFDKLYNRAEIFPFEDGSYNLRIKLADPDHHGENIDLYLPVYKDIRPFISQGRLDIIQYICENNVSELAKVEFDFSKLENQNLDTVMDSSEEER